jgi:basic membrane protein A and related proteins
VLPTIVLATCTALFGGCAKSTAPPPPPRIALLVDAAGFSDGSYNAGAAAGLAACAAVTGAQITRATPSPDSDAEAHLTLLATENFDEIVTVGNGMAVAVGIVARKFETSHFAIVDGFVPAPNVVSIAFKDQDGSFLAGALAALASHTKHVAFLGGADIPRLHAAEAGFAAGAREIDPHVRVSVAFVGSFLDKAQGAAHAGALYDGGADVVYVVAGPAGLGALAEAKHRRNAYAIGADSNQDALAPGKVLTSVLKRVDHATERVCSETAGRKPASGPIEMGLAEGGVSLTDFRFSKAVVGARTMARLGRIEDAIVARKIVPPATAAELASFRSVSVP